MSNAFGLQNFAMKSVAACRWGKRGAYYDQDISKLALRVTAAGTKTFYIVKRVGGDMVWFKLGVFPEMTVEQARRTGK